MKSYIYASRKWWFVLVVSPPKNKLNLEFVKDPLKISFPRLFDNIPKSFENLIYNNILSLILFLPYSY